MADSTQPWTILIFFFFSLLIPLSLSSPQNIETFYPTPHPPPPPPENDSPPPIITIPPAIQLPQSPPPKASGSGNKVAKAVAVTAASTLVVTALAALLIQRYIAAKRKREKVNGVATATAAPGGGGGGGDGRPLPLQSRSSYVRYQGDVKGFIVDENGLDVLYWRKLERTNSNSPRNSHDLRKEVLRSQRQREDERRKNEAVQEIPLLRGKSSSSHVKVSPENNDDIRDRVNDVIRAYGIRNESFNSVPRRQQSNKPRAGIVLKPEPELPSSRSSSGSGPPLASAPPTPPPQPPPATPFLSVPKQTAVPPPPMPANKAPAPPPAPPISINKPPAAPPAPVVSVNKPPAPPPPPKAQSQNGMSKPPPAPAPPPPKGKTTVEKPVNGESASSGGDGNQVKLKPLHWDKVNMVNAEHSMVWDKINDGGSFRFDGDLMEALFGYVATNKKSPKGSNTNTTTTTNNINNQASSQTFILDTRKSQNIAIVLKSLYVSRKEVIDALMEGIGLSQETLEKLSRVAPTAEEQSQILEYSGDPTRLADAESFLFHILKAVPSAFTRLNAMLYRSSYGSEITQLKDSLQTLELACNELRTRGLFLKLLEAILKAGNRMNAGTSRGNAQAFNLTSLRKLSDVKSADGKTTLLHFVVEEVVRSEGKRCVLNRNRSLNRTNSSASTSLSSSSEREKEYVMLGLPVVGGLSSEFSNVKKAAVIDYDAVSSTCSALSKRAAEIRRLIVAQSVKGGFAKEMESFLDSVDDELGKVDKERVRVLEVVSKTTEYYQAGASRDKEAHPFQLFVIVKDFLAMVDQVCVEIARNMQRRRGIGVSSPKVAAPPRPERVAVRFPYLPENFMSDKSSGRSSSDESDDE